MPDERARERELNEFWNALIAGEPDGDGDAHDAEEREVVRRLQRLGAATSSGASAQSKWPKVLARIASESGSDLPAPTVTGPAAARPPFAPNGRGSGATVRWTPPEILSTPRRWSLGQLAAAVLVVVLLAGSLVAALYPLRGRDNVGLPIVAPPDTLPAEKTLLDLTLTDIPRFRGGGFAITDYPPGASSRLQSGDWSEILYIAAGPMTMRVEEAGDSVRVILPRDAGTPVDRFMRKGEETVLESGATVVAPAGAVFELRNSGSAPTRMLTVLRSLSSRDLQEGGAIRSPVFGALNLNIAPPLSVTLQLVTLAADDVLPAPDASGATRTIAVADSNRNQDLHYRSDDSYRNSGVGPLQVYVLIMTRDEDAAPRAGASDASGVLELLWETTGEPEPFTRPYGLGVDPDGNLWVANGGADRFEIYAPDGTHLETWGTPGSGDGEFEFYAPESGYGIAYGDVNFDAEGNIYVLDTGNHRVQKFDADRNFLFAWGSKGTGDGQFLAAPSIAIGSDGPIYVADEGRHDVQIFDSDGSFIGKFGEQGAGDGQFLVTGGVDVDATGDVWVTDYTTGRVEHFSADGEFLDAIGSPGDGDGEIREADGVAVDDMGNVFLIEAGNLRVQVLTTDGQFVAKIGGPNGPVSFTGGNGIAIDDAGIIYVSDDRSVKAFRFYPADG